MRYVPWYSENIKTTSILKCWELLSLMGLFHCNSVSACVYEVQTAKLAILLVQGGSYSVLWGWERDDNGCHCSFTLY